MLGLDKNRSNESLGNCLFLAIFILATPFRSVAQGASPLLEVHPGLSIEHLGARYSIRTHIVYSLSASFLPSEKTRIGISASFGNPTSEYDLVGLAGIEEIHVSAFEVFVAYRIVKVFDAFDLSARGGVGLTILSTDERSVTVGAIGVVRVPGRSERAASYSVGLIASRELFPRVSAFVSPRVLLISPVQMSSLGYSIGGGLSLGIF